jgi:hypothetical protein
MTNGQQRGVRELERLAAVGGSAFELVGKPTVANDWLVATVSVCLGVIEMRTGGLDLREREEFTLFVPPGFPFDRPFLMVAHSRFAGFPHVTWGKWLCLYQSNIEWNPADGLYGFFDRLGLWLTRAAINEMDPVEGPLEPPHHNTDFSQRPFVVRADAPCAAGERWVGLAILDKQANRTELVGWNDLSGEWPQQPHLAFAVFLPEAIPMEFPSKGAELFRVFQEAGLERERLLKYLALAAALSTEDEPLHLVIGLPMRRAKDGSQRNHIAVWTVDADGTKLLKAVLPETADTHEILGLRTQLKDALAKAFETSNIKWCQVLEDRPEIVVRRDSGTPVAWFAGKKVLVLGCGALGSWAAEIVARARPCVIHLVDNAVVKPGILARQNFELQDIGANKANALRRRLLAITSGCEVVAHAAEAHAFVVEARQRLCDYDVVLDCTASSIFQMKLERDWASFSGATPLFISLIIDAQAKHCLSVVVPANSGGGIWDAYVSLKHLLCTEGSHPAVIKAFYSGTATENLFQPEPGCSDPTFVGSTADVVGLTSMALNNTIGHLQSEHLGFGIVLSAPTGEKSARVFDVIRLPQIHDSVVGKYRVRMATQVFTQARAWVRQNNRRRSSEHETGGLLWGLWDDAVQVIWIFDLSGPPADSEHNPAHFLCGVDGTVEEHRRRAARTYGTSGFVGHWHTHPDLPSKQSGTDVRTMASLVSTLGQNQKRSAMLIFGRTRVAATAGIYVYESESVLGNGELLSVGTTQFRLKTPVV